MILETISCMVFTLTVTTFIFPLLVCKATDVAAEIKRKLEKKEKKRKKREKKLQDLEANGENGDAEVSLNFSIWPCMF